MNYQSKSKFINQNRKGDVVNNENSMEVDVPYMMANFQKIANQGKKPNTMHEVREANRSPSVGSKTKKTTSLNNFSENQRQDTKKSFERSSDNEGVASSSDMGPDEL